MHLSFCPGDEQMSEGIVCFGMEVALAIKIHKRSH